MDRFTGASHDPQVEARLTELLTHLYGFYHTEIELSLDRTYRFLGKLGNPHLRLPPVVHIAGTNGKGSTTATLRALLEAAGQSVHVYTSPHLVHATERIRLAGMPIGSQALIDVVTECIEINNGEPITFFEMFTCAAFLAFSRVSADWLLLETGMGGRLDTTNVVSNPVLTVITTISCDHQKFLGDTVDKIAFEKAGILKPGVPCIVGYQLPEFDTTVREVIHRSSRKLSPASPLLFAGADWSSEPRPPMMLFRYGNDSITLPAPRLPGIHQYANAGAALAAFRTIAPAHFLREILSTGLASVEWPGRLQTLKNHFYNEILPFGWEIVIDGGHNDSAGAALATYLEDRVMTGSVPVHLVVAMVNRKDAASFLRPLVPFAASITLTEIAGEATSFEADELRQVAETLSFRNIFISATPDQAVRQIRENHLSPGLIVITGSLFLIGNILKEGREIS